VLVATTKITKSNLPDWFLNNNLGFLVNFYEFTEAIAQSDGFGATPSIIPYKSTKNLIWKNIIENIFPTWLKPQPYTHQKISSRLW
jgi:hypothetical protein